MRVFFCRRYHPAFYPVHRESWPVRTLITLMRTIKGSLFGCLMCGNCILPETAFICPMTCPRGLRNGPCRGSTKQSCFIDRTRPCVWLEIFRQAEQKGKLEQLLEINSPLDQGCLGDEPLLGYYRLWRKQDQAPRLRHLLTDKTRFKADWEVLHRKLRQPEWWQGDSQYHPPAYTEPVSELENLLRTGEFPISAEVAPPLEATGDRIARVACCLKGYVTTANFTDNPMGVPRMSGLACARQSLENGLEPVLQLQTRHRNRYDIAAQAVGAAGMGVRNILCLSDDIGRLGPGPLPRPEINDLDAVQAVWMLRRLRDEGITVAGESVEERPRYFLGAATAPFSALPRYEAIITEKKINAGAQFLQTLPVFDLARFDVWLEALDKRNLLGKVYLMPTVAYLKNARFARFMASEVPGIYIPPVLIDRLEKAADPREEGITIALHLLAGLRGKSGVHGLHILAPREEEIIPRLVKGLQFRVKVVGGASLPGTSNGHNGKNGHQAASPPTFSAKKGSKNLRV